MISIKQCYLTIECISHKNITRYKEAQSQAKTIYYNGFTIYRIKRCFTASPLKSRKLFIISSVHYVKQSITTRVYFSSNYFNRNLFSVSIKPHIILKYVQFLMKAWVIFPLNIILQSLKRSRKINSSMFQMNNNFCRFRETVIFVLELKLLLVLKYNLKVKYHCF